MSLQKNLTIQYGAVQVDCEYHTITETYFNFKKLPIFDENDDMIEEGPNSVITISSYVNKAVYDNANGSQEMAIRNKNIEVPMMLVYATQRFIGSNTPEDVAYQYIIDNEPEFAGATIVS